MSIISYAQNFEDVMLWRALGEIEHGFYIDIGAQDPIIDSVSLAFHEHGWRGIHVEPTPNYAELLRQQRPGDTVIQAAVGKGPAKLPFFEIPETGISTADPVIAQQHRERGFDVHEITVPCIALSAVFKTCAGSEIHWLKIDVEGFEKQVLSSWGKSAARPWIVVVESTLPLTQIETHESWEAILTGYGYTPVYFDGLNRYYISDAHPELKNAFLAPPNVFDGFALNGTASAPFHHLIDARYKERISEILSQNEQQKLSADNEIERLTLSLAALDKTHTEHVQKWVQREQEVAAQLLAVQQQAALEKAELALNRSEQARALQRQTADREQTLAQQLQSGQQELRRLEQDRAQREKEHAEQTSQTRQELDTLLRTQAQREQDVAAQLLAIQQQATQDKTEQARSHSEQERVLQREHGEREQSLNQQLHAGQQELRRLEQDRAQREQVLSEQTSQTRQELESLLRTLAQREQEVAAQLLAIQQQASLEKAELARNHSEQTHALQRLTAEREQTLAQQLQAGQQELRRLEQDRAQREKEHAEQTSQTRQELEALLRTQAQREQEVAAQLLTIQQQAAQEKTEQARSHSEQERALQRQHTEREQTLSQQLLAAQQEFYRLEQDRAQREKVLDKEIAALQSETQALHHAQQLQAQQHNLEINTKQDEHIHLIQSSAALQADLKAQIQAEQQTSLRLRRELIEVQQNLKVTHASLTWRMTRPLRSLAALIVPQKNPGATTTHITEEVVPQHSIMPTVIETPPTNVEQVSNEAIMFPSSPATNPPRPIVATTLDELLAYHDQQFVHCAYQTLLGREPDSEGMGYYLDRLRVGVPKIQILGQMLHSREARVSGVELPGLRNAVKLHKLARLPLVGTILKRFVEVEGNSVFENRLRALEQRAFLLVNQADAHFEHIDHGVNSLQQLIVQQGQQLLASVQQSLAAIAPVVSVSEPTAKMIQSEASYDSSNTPAVEGHDLINVENDSYHYHGDESFVVGRIAFDRREVLSSTLAAVKQWPLGRRVNE